MGLVEKLAWANEYGKRRCRRAYWRVRAEIRKVVKNMHEQRLRFQYDASSYALNFDDGSACAGGCLDDTIILAWWFLHFMYIANLQNLIENLEEGAEGVKKCI
ncbi:unnamed protein product [Victoria cruziana]